MVKYTYAVCHVLILCVSPVYIRINQSCLISHCIHSCCAIVVTLLTRSQRFFLTQLAMTWAIRKTLRARPSDIVYSEAALLAAAVAVQATSVMVRPLRTANPSTNGAAAAAHFPPMPPRHHAATAATVVPPAPRPPKVPSQPASPPAPSPSAASFRRRSSSTTSNSGEQRHPCYYHRRFGAAAQRCTPSCTWTENSSAAGGD